MRVFEVQASSSSPRLPLRQISLFCAVSIIELAHGEKSNAQSLTQTAYLMHREPTQGFIFFVLRPSPTD